MLAFMWDKTVAAIGRKSVNEVRQLLRQSPELAIQKNYQDETLLHFAASIGSPEITADLLVRGAKPDLPDEFGWTPLHEACNNGNEAIVAMFLQLPFNLDGVSRKGETALHLATRQGYERIVKQLLQAGANHEFRNRDGNTPMHVAALAGRVDLLQTLLDAGGDIHARNLLGETPLHSCAREGRIEAAIWCLAHGADANEQDKGYRTFIDTAVREGRHLFVEYFSNLEQPIPSPDNPNPLAATGLRLDVTINLKTMATQARKPGGKLFRAYLFGVPHMTNRMMPGAVLETVLLFFAFPFLIFTVFAGLAKGLLPRPIPVPGTWSAEQLPMVSAGLNTLVFFLISHFFTTSPEGGRRERNSLRIFRGTIWVRLLHFAIPAALMVRSLPFDAFFQRGLSLFWLWYMMLYSMLFIGWWAGRDTPPPPPAPTAADDPPLRFGSS